MKQAGLYMEHFGGLEQGLGIMIGELDQVIYNTVRFPKLIKGIVERKARKTSHFICLGSHVDLEIITSKGKECFQWHKIHNYLLNYLVQVLMGYMNCGSVEKLTTTGLF